MKFKTGIFPSEPDNRDFIYKEVKPFKSTTLPKKFILEEWEVNNQKEFGICGGESASAIKDFQESNELGYQVDTSPLFAYSCAKKYDGYTGIAGTTPRAIMQALQKDGICFEKTFPFELIVDDKFPPKPTEEAIKEAQQFKIKNYVKVSTVEEIKRALVENNSPVATAFNWFSGMFECEGKEFLPMPSGNYVGGHLVAITGFQDDLEFIYSKPYLGKRTYKGFFRLRNSWGSEFGSNGYCWIPYDMISEHADFYLYFVEGWTSVDLENPPIPGDKEEDNENKTIETKKFDVTPTLVNNRTLLELRNLATITGCSNINWDSKERKVSLHYNGNKVINLWIGKKQCEIVTGLGTSNFTREYKQFDVEPQIIQDRTMLELRSLAMVTGCTYVDWKQQEQEVILYYPTKEIHMWLYKQEYQVITNN